MPVESGDFLDDVAKERECCVCLEKEKTMVFAPCGHHVRSLPASHIDSCALYSARLPLSTAICTGFY